MFFYRKISIGLVFLFLMVANTAFSQECECENCPLYMPDGFVDEFYFTVSNATNNDLSNPNQGVCGVTLNFQHQFISDLEISLISPSGQEIYLIGPNPFITNPTDFSTWDVTFIPCSETAEPDFILPAVWDNYHAGWTMSMDYTGTYYPFTNECLEDFTGNVNGIWTLVVEDGTQDDAGFFADFSIQFCDETGINCDQDNDPCPLFAIIEHEDTFCEGGTLVLDGSNSYQGPGVTYSWEADFGGQLPSGSNNTPIIEVTTGGEYTLFVTGLGCQREIETFIFDPGVSPDLEISQNLPLNCDNTSVILNAVDNSTAANVFYNWFEGNENTIDFSTAVAISDNTSLEVTEAGEYTVFVINLNGLCVGTYSYIVVDESDFPTAMATSTGNIDCNNSEVDLMGDSDDNFASFAWSGPNGFMEGIANPTGITEGGEYILTVTNDSGCTTTSSVMILDDSTLPTVDAGADGTISCDAASSTFVLDGSGTTGTGTLSYEWILDDNGTPTVVNTDTTDPTFETNVEGTYTLVVTDAANGCTNTATATITSNAMIPTVDVDPPNPFVDCNNNAQVNGVIGNVGFSDVLTFSWLDENGDEVSTTQGFTTPNAGTYTLIVTNTSNDCSQTSMPVMIADNTAEPTADAGIDASIDCAMNTVTLTGTGTGGTNLTYTWLDAGSPVGIGATYTATAGGTYTLLVTNMDTGCTQTDDIVVIENIDLPIADAGTALGIDCVNMTSSLSASATNGTNFSYEWFDANEVSQGMGATISVMDGGMYTVIVTNTDNGCTDDASVMVSADDTPPTVNAGMDDDLSCLNNQQVDLIGMGTGTGNLTYEWFNAAGMSQGTGANLTVTTNDTYTLQITDDANGCSETDEVVIGEDTAAPMVDAGADLVLTCLNNQQVDLMGAATGATMVSYQWQDENNVNLGTNSMQQATTPGVYTLIATNTENGCTADATVTVTEDIQPPQDVTAVDGVITCIPGTLDLMGGTSSSGVSVSWEGPGGYVSDQASPTITSEGTYTFIVTNDSNGCTASADAIIDSDADTPAGPIIDYSVDFAIFNCNQGTFDLEGTHEDPTVTLTWTLPDMSTDANPMISVAQPGLYGLTATATNGCSSTAQLTIIEDTDPPVIDATTGGLLDCDNLTIDLGLSTTSIVDYMWSGAGIVGSNTDPTPTVNMEGTYLVTITDSGNGCTAETNIEVTADATPPTVTVASLGTTIDCNNPTLELSADSPDMGLNYAWSDGSNMSTNMISAGGTYAVTVTNPTNNCTATADLMITEDTATPMATADGEDIDCLNNMMAQLTGTTDAMNVSYDWSSPMGFSSVEQNPIATQAGIYTFTVTNTDNGCTNTATYDVGMNTNPPDIGTQGGELDCLNPTISLTGNSTTANASFLWTGPGIDVSNETEASPTVSAEGTYVLVVTNPENGCTAEEAVSVTQDAGLPTASVTGSLINCMNQADGVELMSTSSVNGATFTWTGPGINAGNESDQNPIVEEGGTYTVTASDPSNGCSAQASYTVVEELSAPADVTATGATLLCTTPDVQLMGASSDTNVSYTWSGGSIDATNANDQNPTVTSAGTYDLVVTLLSNGCTATATAMVEPDFNLPSVSAGSIAGSVVDCANQTMGVQIDGSSTTQNTSLSWEYPDGTIEADPMPFVTEPGTYTLTVTSGDNGCTNTSTVVILGDFDEPMATATGGMITCTETTFQLLGESPSTGANFEWTGPGIEPFNMNFSSPEVAVGGMYELLVTGANGCTSTATAEVTLDENLPDALVAIDEITLTCVDTEATLDGSNSASGMMITYEWIGPNGNLSTDLTTTTSDAGVYTLIVSDGENGCTNTAIVNVLEDTTPPADVTATGAILLCTTPDVQLMGASSDTNVSYTWSGGSIDATNANDQNPSVTASGNYNLVVTLLSNGCTAEAMAMVEPDFNLPSVSAGSTAGSVLDCTNEAMGVQIDGSSTTPNTSLSWEYPDGTIETDLMPFVTEPGTYTLTVISDDNGCSNTSTVVILGNFDEPEGMATGGTLTCTDTEVNIEVSSPNVGATFEWAGPGIEAFNMGFSSPAVAESGTYSVIITGTNGCTSEATTVVDTDTLEPIIAVVTDELTLTCTETMVDLDGTGSATDATMTYEWTAPNGMSIGSGLVATTSTTGLYTLSVSNTANGCSSTETINVIENITPPVADAGMPQDYLCSTTELTLDASNSTGQGTLSYVWDGIGDTPQVTIFGAGTYSLVVTDSANGCTAIDEVEITPDLNLPVPAIASSNILTCSDTETNLDGTGSTSISGNPLMYEWTFNGNFVSAVAMTDVSEAGVYTLLVTDATNGCSNSTTFEVAEEVNPPTVLIATPSLLTCNDPSLVLDGTGTDTGNVSYLWTASNGGNIVSGETTLNPTIDDAGTYTLLVTNMDNDCTEEMMVAVLEDANFPNAVINAENEFTCANEEVNLNSAGSSGGSEHEYAWTGPGIISDATSATISIDAAGTYELLVTNTTTGCSQTITTDIPANENMISEATIESMSEACINDNDGLIAIEGVTGGTPPYSYAINDGLMTESPIFTGLEPATYTIMVQDAEGCFYETEEELAPGIDLTFDLGPDITVDLGTVVDLVPDVNSIVDTILWNNSIVTGNQPSFAPVNTSSYTATVIDENGCEQTDNITIFVDINRNVFIPNAFSPANEDSVNDIFYIQSDNSVQIIKNFQVFDRWGAQVFAARDFETNDPRFGWNGLHNGKVMAPAVFVYYAEIEFKDGLVELFTGDITLMK